MLAEGDVDIIEGGQDINLARKNDNSEAKKKCCA